jgi:hypothetical protein
VILATNFHLAPRLRMSGAAPLFFQYAVMPAQGQLYLYLYLYFYFYPTSRFLLRENTSVLYSSSFSGLVVHYLPEQKIYHRITHVAGGCF